MIKECAYRDCDELGIYLVYNRIAFYGRSKKKVPTEAFVKNYCEVHATRVVERDYPEYTVHCPNCNCMFGVN